MEKIMKIPCFEGTSKDVLTKGIPTEIIEKSLESLNGHKVIAVPTDTIYGVACLAQSNDAVEMLYDIKHRHREKAIAICVGSVNDVKRWGKVTVSDDILHDLLPGPVTLIFKRSDELNEDLNPATDKIGIRIPNHGFIMELSQRCGQPIALTSANISSTRSSLKVKEFEELWPKLGVIVDGGPLGNTEEARLGSTVVDLSAPGEFTIVRDGCALDLVLRILMDKYGMRKNTGPTSSS